MKKWGIIINNIGSPSGSDANSVGRYLKEFLMDEHVLNIPAFFRYILVHLIIVPRRKYASSEKYQKVWGQTESPLLEITKSFAAKLQNELGQDYMVRAGMRYGEPSIEQAISEMKSVGVEKIFFAPMYPQYAKASTYSAENKAKNIFDSIFGESKAQDLQILKPFFNRSDFIQQSAAKLDLDWKTKNWDHVLFSFHGLPESQIKKIDGCLATSDCCSRANACALNCYRAQSVASAQAIAKVLNIKPENYSISFQSRLGPAKWIQPASIDRVAELARQGSKRLLVQSPSFVADCLETLEEVSFELSDEFKKYGGEKLKLVSCLNDDSNWVKSFAIELKNDLAST